MDRIIRTIKAVSVKSKATGSIGFLTEEEDNHWYNVKADEKVLDELLKDVIGKGNLIEFEVENGFVTNVVLKEKSKQAGNFTDDMTTFEDLLADAHDKFDWISIKTEMIQNDWEKQRAIFKATVETLNNGETKELIQSFQAYGDATQDNCGDMVKKHYIRMAETRAIARALRWATNNAAAAEEETENGELTDEQMQEAMEEQAKP